VPKVKSKAQQRKLFALERRGQLKKGTAKRHAKSGKAFKKLPNRVKKRKGKRKR
jgi:hypothetical protein